MPPNFLPQRCIHTRQAATQPARRATSRDAARCDRCLGVPYAPRWRWRWPQEVKAPTHDQTVPIDRYGEPGRFYARPHQPCQFAYWVMELHGARLMHAADGCYQFTGEEFDWSRQQHHRQTWLCTPTPARGYEILRRMADAGGRRAGL